jgi:hypothetical protein
LIVIFADLITFIYAGTNAGWIPWNRVLLSETALLVAVLAAVWLVYSRQIGFIRDAAVTTAAVMDAGTLSLWGIQLFRRPTGPGSLKRALEEEDDGEEEDTLHLVTVRLRFVPGALNENMDWALLRDEIPHCDVTKRIRGGWGTFASDLQQGSLVSLLYDPHRPKRCRLIRLRNMQKGAISE